jgi:hypothetical protein
VKQNLCHFQCLGCGRTDFDDLHELWDVHLTAVRHSQIIASSVIALHAVVCSTLARRRLSLALWRSSRSGHLSTTLPPDNFRNPSAALSCRRTIHQSQF